MSVAKLKADWDGPFEVTRVISEVTVILRSVRGKLYKAHVDQIRYSQGIHMYSQVFIGIRMYSQVFILL